MTHPPELTIIIPTYNERENIRPLVERLERVLEGINWSALFVDDNSPDQTADVVGEVGRYQPRVKCLLRIGRRGLSSACIEGLQAAEAPYLAVMDADLQHDETILPRMLDALKQNGIELVVASRYSEGGDMSEWSRWRRFVSKTATYLAKMLFAHGSSDPMSGFFMLRRDLFEEVGRKLSGRGFKILLDFFLSADRPLAFQEVPYSFRLRHAGESKLDVRVTWDLIELLAEKTIGRVIPTRFLFFTGVGAFGILVHLAVLGLANQGLGFRFDVSQLMAILVAMTSNFYMNNVITYRDKSLKGKKILRGLLSFYIACGFGGFINFAVAVFVSETWGPWALAGFAGAVAGAVWNFSTTSIVTWGDQSHSDADGESLTK